MAIETNRETFATIAAWHREAHGDVNAEQAFHDLACAYQRWASAIGDGYDQAENELCDVAIAAIGYAQRLGVLNYRWRANDARDDSASSGLPRAMRWLSLAIPGATSAAMVIQACFVEANIRGHDLQVGIDRRMAELRRGGVGQTEKAS